MTLILPPGYATFAIEHWLANYPRPAVCVWGLHSSGGFSDPTDAANDLQAAYIRAFATGIDSNVTIRSSRLTIGQDGGDPIVGTASASGPGTAVRESTAPALSVMLSLNTGLGGRRNRGRKFLPWAASDNSVSEQGALDPALVTAWNARAAAFMSELSGLGAEPVILHSTGSTVPGSPTPVTSITTNPVIRTQRNRQTRF